MFSTANNNSGFTEFLQDHTLCVRDAGQTFVAEFERFDFEPGFISCSPMSKKRSIIEERFVLYLPNHLLIHVYPMYERRPNVHVENHH